MPITQMRKALVTQSNDCGDICQEMGDILTKLTEDNFTKMNEDQCVALSSDILQAHACLTRCRTMLNEML